MIIGIAGKKNAGKDTVGNYLVDEYGFTKLYFAAAGKQVICETFDITLDQLEELKNNEEARVILEGIWSETEEEYMPRRQMTFRQFIQALLNEGMKSAYGELFHVNNLLPSDFQHRGFKYVICDVRFPFEAMRIRELGGYVVRVERTGLDDSDTHKSEKPLPHDLIDFTLPNYETIEELHKKADGVLEMIAGLEGVGV